MVGRPYPKYEGYNSKDDSEEEPKQKKRKDEEEEKFPKSTLDLEKEYYEQEKLKSLQREEIRGIKREISTLEHPRTTALKSRMATAKSGFLGFAGQLAKEGVRATRSRSVKKKGGVRVRRSMAYPSVFHPVSTDISLSRAIAVNNWSGENTGLMERDFFGVDNREQDLLGDRNRDINIGGSFQQDFFGEKKDIDLLGGTHKLELDLLGGKNKKKKEIQYI